MQPEGRGMSSCTCPFKKARRQAAYIRSMASSSASDAGHVFVDAILQLFAAREERHPLLRDLHLRAGARVAALTGPPGLGDEAAEAPDLDAIVAGEGAAHAVEDRVDDDLHVPLRHVGHLAGHLFDELALRQPALLTVRWYRGRVMACKPLILCLFPRPGRSALSRRQKTRRTSAPA